MRDFAQRLLSLLDCVFRARRALDGSTRMLQRACSHVYSAFCLPSLTYPFA